MIDMRRHTRLVTYLDGSAHTLAEVGGKAAGIDLLLRHEYQVPPAAVITTAAYQTAIAEESLRLLVEDLRISTLPPPDRIAAESAAIERAFLAAPIPESVTTAIAKLGADLLRNGPVAVRSSATAEDLADASFAGQYLTITGVSSIAEMEQAVRRCWASLWMPSARAYRRRHRVPERRIAMAVIVQTMVNPAWSGVVFTKDPQGQGHLMRIEAVPGLGESLVSGKATPADFYVRRATLAVRPSAGAESLDFLEDLARLALRVEQSAGAPQDIEWAYSEDGISLLQVRPITEPATPSGLDDGLDTASLATATYTPNGVIEMVPGVISPLLWTINAPMLDNAFRTTFADLGGTPPDKDRPIVARFGGRAALDLSSICDIAGTLPGGDPAEVERQYLGETITSTPPASNRGGIHLFAALRGRRVRNRIGDEVDLTASAASALARLQIELTTLPTRLLMAYRQRIRDLAWRGYAAEVGASSAAGASYRALEVLLARWMTEPEAASWAQILTSAAIDHSSVGAGWAAELDDVLDRYGTDAITEILRSPAAATRSRLRKHGSDGQRFLTALDKAVQAMGSKAVYGDTTWAEDEPWIWRHLQLIATGQARHPARQTDWTAQFAELRRHLATNRRWHRTRILTGQVMDLRVRWLRRQIEETLRFLRMRERAKNALLVLGGEERRIILETTDRLVASRQLPSKDLIQFVTDAELERMLFGVCGVSAAELDRRRAVSAACDAAGPLPDWFIGHPDAVPRPDIPETDRLQGWAASPGKASGPVKIISSLADGVRLEHGDILVAHATDPSWTPLFLVAGGIVLEMGGPLSHAAIVAREFGLPAVLNVPHATLALNEQDTVAVDGTEGLVERITAEGTG